MRGQKGSEYDGGSGSFLYALRPKGGMNKLRKIDTLCHAIDVVPTLLDLTGGKSPKGISLTELQFVPCLRQKAKQIGRPDVDYRFPTGERSSQVEEIIGDEPRLETSESERTSYNIKADPGQEKNVAVQHPDRVAKMQAFYDQWWSE